MLLVYMLLLLSVFGFFAVGVYIHIFFVVQCIALVVFVVVVDSPHTLVRSVTHTHNHTHTHSNIQITNKFGNCLLVILLAKLSSVVNLTIVPIAVATSVKSTR